MLRVICLTLFLPVAALAQGTQVNLGGMQQDTSAPVEVTADQLEVNQTDGTAIYTGDVIIIQGEMRLAAPWVLVIFSEAEGTIDRMEAKGGVTMVSATEAAEAEQAEYDVESGIVVMTGDVLLTQGDNAMVSERMVVDLNTGEAQMAGRVRTVLQPGGNN